MIRPEFLDARLIKNYSDWGTEALVADIPEKQRLSPKHGRIAGDANRAPDAPDLFREEDFGGVPIFQQPLSDELKQQMLEKSYVPYHRETLKRLLQLHGNPNNPLLVVDLHDTGNLLMGEMPEQDQFRHVATGWNMPPLILSDQEGKTASQEVVNNLVNAFQHHFKLRPKDIRINDPYKGGYFTQRYGLPDSDIAKDLREAPNPQRNVVQIELGRYLYMDEKTQELNNNAVTHYRKKLAAVLRDVADGLM